jgi:hypothetical protein
MRKVKMGSIWNFKERVDDAKDANQCIFAQVDTGKFAMIIIKGEGKGNRWRGPIELIMVQQSAKVFISDEDWIDLTGTHYTFTEAE